MKNNNTKYINNNHITIRKITKKKQQKKIRIIGGKWRGKKISTIQHPDLKPTTNQIRETLFNWLTPIITNTNCLDCFAGSGALGLEALSRYADTVTFLEKNQHFTKKINKIIQYLQAQTQTRIITTDSNKWLMYSKHIKPYDIIFLDPPFSKWYYIQNTIKLLEKFQHLSKNAWIYIEHSTNNRLLSIPKTWKLHKKKLQEMFLIKYILNIKQNYSEYLNNLITKIHTHIIKK